MHGKIVDSFGGVPRDLAWRLKSGVTPDKLFTIILECGQSYAFHDLEVFGIRDYMNRFGEEFDCIHCDSFLTRTSKRLAGHHLSGALYRLGRSAASTKSEMSIAVIAAIIPATTPLGIVAVLVLAGGRRTAPLSSSNIADQSVGNISTLRRREPRRGLPRADISTHTQTPPRRADATEDFSGSVALIYCSCHSERDLHTAEAGCFHRDLRPSQRKIEALLDQPRFDLL